MNAIPLLEENNPIQIEMSLKSLIHSWFIYLLTGNQVQMTVKGILNCIYIYIYIYIGVCVYVYICVCLSVFYNISWFTFYCQVYEINSHKLSFFLSFFLSFCLDHFFLFPLFLSSSLLSIFFYFIPFFCSLVHFFPFLHPLSFFLFLPSQSNSFLIFSFISLNPFPDSNQIILLNTV